MVGPIVPPLERSVARGGVPPEEGQRSRDKFKVKWRPLTDRS